MGGCVRGGFSLWAWPRQGWGGWDTSSASAHQSIPPPTIPLRGWDACARVLDNTGASAGPDNRQAASDKWPQRTAESQMSNVGGRELARPPPSDAEGWQRLPHLVRSTES